MRGLKRAMMAGIVSQHETDNVLHPGGLTDHGKLTGLCA
jgi:hypothetical protein